MNNKAKYNFVPNNIAKTKQYHRMKTIKSLKLEVSDPSKLLYLCSQLVGNDSNQLEIHIDEYLKQETNSKQVFIIHLSWDKREAKVKVYDNKQLERPEKIPLSAKTFFDIVIFDKNEAKCSEKLDPQIQDLISKLLGKKGGEAITVPVLCSFRKFTECPKRNVFPVFLVCFVNSELEQSRIVRLVGDTFRFCLALFLNTIQLEEERRLKIQSQSLLHVARILFAKLQSVDDLISEIMQLAKELTDADRCALFLKDEDKQELYSKVFDGGNIDMPEIRFPKHQGIAGYTAETGNLLNIDDAYKHPLFNKQMDKKTGYVTRNILCVPIISQDGVIGVAQLCNKKNGSHFDSVDEEIASAYAIYCALSLRYSLLYKQLVDQQIRNKLTNELLMYQKKISKADVDEVLKCPKSHIHPDLDKLYFNPRDIIFAETGCFVIKMMEELDFNDHYQIRSDYLVRFILHVQRGYRDVPYHNWYHAFSAGHFAYLCIKNFQLVEKGFITKLEAFAYFISCLCHDLDHRGTTNSFQKESNSPLANLYSSEGSVLERHHLSQAFCILNTENCNILDALPSKDYKKFLDYVKDIILATDLVVHFKHMSRQICMIREGYKRNNPEHRYLLLSLLMTCADLNDQTKRFSVVKFTAQRVMEEFFSQGDMEKAMGYNPMAMMDRNECFVPSLQISFITFVCSPVYKILAVIFPLAKEFVRRIKRNIYVWEVYGDILQKLGYTSNSLEALNIPKLEEEVLKIVNDYLGPEF